MIIIRSIAMSFAMFSRLPMPKMDWSNANMRYLLAALPLVGIVCGALLAGWAALCNILEFSSLLWAAGATVLPLLLTGGIHLDGLADTSDALASHGDAQQKRAILKDPHAGAFAIIAVAVWLIWELAVYNELPIADILLIALIPICSRAEAAVLSLLLPSMAQEGLLTTFKGAADKTAALVILLLFFAAAMVTAFLFSPVRAGFILAAGIISGAHTAIMSWRQFKGISGDIAGYCIEMTELLMLTALMLCEKVVIL